MQEGNTQSSDYNNERKDKLKARKDKYKKVLELLCNGHTYTSASKEVGFSVKHVSKLAKKPFFKRKIQEAEATIIGNVRSALVKRAIGYEVVETKEYYDPKTGKVTETSDLKHIPSDTKASLAWLSAKDKEGGWVQGNQVNIQLNQQLSGVSSEDLLLTLRSAQAISGKVGGEGGVLSASVCETNNLPPNQPASPLNLPNSHNTYLNAPSDPVDTAPLSRGYNADYDSYHERHGKKLETKNNFYDHNQGKLDEPTEGEFDNLGEDVLEEEK